MARKKNSATNSLAQQRLVFLLLLFIAFSLSIITNRALYKIKSLNNSNNHGECKHSKYQYSRVYPEYAEDDCVFGAPSSFEIKELDNASCRRVSQYFIADRQRVYKQLYDPGSSNYPQYVIVKDAKPGSFTDLGWGYYTDQSNLFRDDGESYSILKNIDIDSLEVLSTYFIKDKNGVYLLDISGKGVLSKLNGFDQASFIVVQNDANHETYSKDKNGVYFNHDAGKVYGDLLMINEADPETFAVLDSYQLARDKNSIYYEGKKVEVRDPSTFELLSRDVFKDNYNVYGLAGGEFTLLPGADGCSYELLDYNYQFGWGSGYSKDKNNVYYQGKIIKGADPKTFKVENDRAYDKDYEYQGIYRVEN